MFNLNTNFKLKCILLMWILLQLSNYYSCNGFMLKPIKRQSTSQAPMPVTALHEHFEDESSKLSVDSSVLNETPQTVEYEDTNTNHKSHATSNLLKKCESCPEGILCVPQIQCPAHVRMKDHEKPQVCDLAGGKFGFCCVTGQNHTGPMMNKARAPLLDVVPPDVVEKSRLKFENLMRDIAKMPVAPGHPDFFHGLVFHSSPQEDIQNFHLTNSALEQVITTQMLSKEEQIPLDDIITNHIDIPFKETPLAHNCQPPRHCSHPEAKYRTFDGLCNNPQPSRSHWGSAGQAMERLLPPAYDDGIWMPRQHSSLDGSLLASAREISRIVMADADRPHPKHNLMLMQFGQFVAHDSLQSASIRLENGELIQCCAPDNAASLPPERRHFACYPIEVSPNDEFYIAFGIRCMNFVRSSLAPNTECRAGYGKQLNKVTHFIDASQVYGSSLETSRELRAFRGGKLRMFNDFGRELLPLTNEKSTCGSEAAGAVCFKSGDGRTNQIISLIAIHILFAREHNRIANILGQLNPHASDELLFQETRRIVIAELQHIIYNEYLPVVIGPMQMKRFRLTTQHHGYSNEYNAEVNPAIMNEFSGAAFRMGHSSVDGRLHVQQEHGQFDEIVQIPDVMFNPSRMRKRTFYDNILKTLLLQPMQKVDSAISHGLSRFLFRGHNPFGLDLAALNIQRGRDNGLRSYNDYLEVMGNRKIQSFNQLPAEVAHKLSRVYRSPDDIDLWVGGLLEKSIDDGIVGSTFSEIIADQFSRLKSGDRYYYEYNRSINPGAFTLDQLHEIRKVTLARIICDNADHLMLNEVPPMAFVRADFSGNRPLRCDSPHIPRMNLEAWRFK